MHQLSAEKQVDVFDTVHGAKSSCSLPLYVRLNISLVLQEH